MTNNSQSTTISSVNKDSADRKTDIVNKELSALNSKSFKKSNICISETEKEIKHDLNYVNNQSSYELGLMLFKNSNDRKSLSRAFELFKIAAKCGVIEANYYIALQNYFGLGIHQNVYEAFKYAYTAVLNGYKPANEILGLCYYHGHGVIANPKKAFKCFKALPNNDVCINNTAVCYLLGKGVASNVSKAIELLKSQPDSPICAFTLAQCYEHGTGVNKDKNTAIKLFKHSMMSGFQPSTIKYYKLTNEVNPKLFKQSLDHSLNNSCYIIINDNQYTNYCINLPLK